eukprot:TRINITY_DN448_c0_g2_i2.p1 TRINITY_DN448_c0_g2~~TRINITY_DN448_c0_g2_i2.p1  ORF type:complete len:438 (-),score=29.18 TRINITY_DN448_c0_g2_i2:167-1396(-)
MNSLKLFLLVLVIAAVHIEVAGQGVSIIPSRCPGCDCCAPRKIWPKECLSKLQGTYNCFCWQITTRIGIQRLKMFCFAMLIFLINLQSGSFEEELLIGWQGETYKPNISKQQLSSHSNEWIELLSWKPRAFLYHNFISHDHADHLILLASKRMERSQVAPDDDSSAIESSRTSFNVFLPMFHDDIVKHTQYKMANWTGFPAENQEQIQILRYSQGQEYQQHYDEFDRSATALIYLTDVEEGGETAFPLSNDWADPKRGEEQNQLFSECAQNLLAVKPRKGDALLFFSTKPDGVSSDDLAMHTGCPVVKGIKWTATIWSHPVQFYFDLSPEPIIDVGLCYDQDNEYCGTIKPSQCDGNNRDYVRWQCPKRCQLCTPCKLGDKQCIKNNREQNGFLYLDDELEQLGIKVAY